MRESYSDAMRPPQEIAQFLPRCPPKADPLAAQRSRRAWARIRRSGLALPYYRGLLSSTPRLVHRFPGGVARGRLGMQGRLVDAAWLVSAPRSKSIAFLATSRSPEKK